jgi:hypothetical protein
MKCAREKKRWEAEARRLLDLFLTTGTRRHLNAYLRHRRDMDIAALRQLITKLAKRRFR